MAKCIKGFEVKVLRSAAGYYIGTLDEEGFPYCRVSKEYYSTQEDAEKALADKSFTERTHCVEVEFCNGGQGCQIK